MQNGIVLKLCHYYVYITVGISILDVFIATLTTYGQGNYCYLTDAMLVGFKCDNFAFAHSIQFILNWPFWFIYSVIFGLAAWPILLVALVLWSPLLYVALRYFRYFVRP